MHVSVRNHSPRRGTAAVGITAEWYAKGGTGEKVFGYSALSRSGGCTAVTSRYG